MKNIIKLKAMARIAGIVVLVALIGFSFAACDDGSGGPSGDKSTNSFTLMQWSNVDPWRGSGNREVYLLDGDTNTAIHATANFSNGSATVPFSSFRQLMD